MTDRTPASPVEDAARRIREYMEQQGDIGWTYHGIASALQAQDHTITKGGLDEWMTGVVSSWREHWEGTDHRYGKDFAAFLGERVITDFHLREQEPYPFGHARAALEPTRD